MIGVYVLWHDPDAALSRSVAFASALRTGFSSARAHLLNGALLCDGYAAPTELPARAPDGSAVLLYGFIENRHAMRAELGVPDEGDAALYAAAWARWGEDADQRLLGEYAVIMVEANGKRVRMARSPIRSPALYFWRDADRLIVTGHAQAIFASGEIERVLDEQKIADTLYLNYREERRGWFKGVARLPRGTRVWATPDGVKETRFFDIENIPPVRFKRDSDYVEAADALFREAVTMALDGFERPAISLSGGLDSQAVAAYTMQVRPDQPLLSFTSVPDPNWTPGDSSTLVDERPHVEALAAMYPQLRPHWVESTGENFTDDQGDIFEASLISPRNPTNLKWIHNVQRGAKGANADVLLTGVMGNATFSYAGNGFLQDMIRNGQWVRAALELWHGGPRRKLFDRTAREAVLPFLPVSTRQALRRRFGSLWSTDLPTWSPIHPEFARDHDVAERAFEMGQDRAFMPPSSVLDFRHATLVDAGNETGDLLYALQRLHGLPNRDPTRYRPLLEFCLAIPPEQYLNRGRKRWLAKRMLVGKVPEMVRNEKRRGLQAADWTARMLPQRQELLAEIEWLSSDPLVKGYLDFDRLRRAVEDMPTDGSSITHEQTQTLKLALSRGLTTARFVRYISGRNDF
ncbi:MAG: asparagine synthase-related protein [Minwuia sp.]|nr:asparagine synthase-related protein [Minwuia sp.]